MKTKRMPTTMILLIFSWLIAISGLIISGYIIIFDSGNKPSLLIAFSVFLGSILLAAIIRMLGNIGQMLFCLISENYGLFNFLHNDIQALKNISEQIDRNLQAVIHNNLQPLKNKSEEIGQNTQQLKAFLQALHTDMQALENSSEQINQNLEKIAVFFNQIQRHLDLKK